MCIIHCCKSNNSSLIFCYFRSIAVPVTVDTQNGGDIEVSKFFFTGGGKHVMRVTATSKTAKIVSFNFIFLSKQ